MSTVDLQFFPSPYVDRADQIFLRPTTLYRWQEIVSGAPVRSQSGEMRRISAVEQNTFRGWYAANIAGERMKDVLPGRRELKPCPKS